MTTQNMSENPARTLESLSDFATRDQLESPEIYRAPLSSVVEVLSQQGYIPTLADLPTIIIPDLHARREMLMAILSAQIVGGPLASKKVFELMQEGRMNVVCVGDIVHSEERSNWVINLDGEWTSELLDKEMVRSLGAAAMIMYLKLQFPEHFYCLRGNHDDMTMELGPFRKFVGVKRNERGELVRVGGRPVFTAEKGESGIVKDWVLDRAGWGQEFLDAWVQFDHALPLIAQGSYFVVSHTLPIVPVTKELLCDANRPHEITLGLTSSRGNNLMAIEETLENLGLKERVERWFYGHTPVSCAVNGGKYQEDLDGLVVRFNNPQSHVFAYVPVSDAQRRFDPTNDVYIKSPDEENFHL